MLPFKAKQWLVFYLIPGILDPNPKKLIEFFPVKY